MKLISNNRRHLPTLSNESWAIETRNRYKSTQDLYRTFSADRVSVYSQNYQQAIASGVPTLVRLTKSYGEDVVAPLLEVHITSAIIAMGEESDVEPTDIKFVAQAICQSENLRTLNMASVMTFFHKLKCGEFKIFGKVTPRKIMEAMQDYVEIAKEKERKAFADIQKQEEKLAWEKHQQEAVTFEQYKASRGYGDEITNPMDLLK